MLNFMGSSSLLCLKQQKLSIKGSRDKIQVNLAAFQGILGVSEVFSQSRVADGGPHAFGRSSEIKPLVRFHLLFQLNFKIFFFYQITFEPVGSDVSSCHHMRCFRKEKETAPSQISQRLLGLLLGKVKKWPITNWRVP